MKRQYNSPHVEVSVLAMYELMSITGPASLLSGPGTQQQAPRNNTRTDVFQC